MRAFPALGLEPSGVYHHPLTFTPISFCPQGNDVRIILGQFDQNMAAKVFCCVSKTLVMSFVLREGSQSFLLDSSSLPALWEGSQGWSLDCGQQKRYAHHSFLFAGSPKLNPQSSEQCCHRRFQGPRFYQSHHPAPSLSPVG